MFRILEILIELIIIPLIVTLAQSRDSRASRGRYSIDSTTTDNYNMSIAFFSVFALVFPVCSSVSSFQTISHWLIFRQVFGLIMCGKRLANLPPEQQTVIYLQQPIQQPLQQQIQPIVVSGPQVQFELLFKF